MSCKVTANASFAGDFIAHSTIKGLEATMNSPQEKCEGECCLKIEYDLGDSEEQAELEIFRFFENSNIPYKVLSRKGL